jgi:hypothetical protein
VHSLLESLYTQNYFWSLISWDRQLIESLKVFGRSLDVEEVDYHTEGHDWWMAKVDHRMSWKKAFQISVSRQVYEPQKGFDQGILCK